MKLSARNVLKGKVKKVTQGAINSEVIVGLPHGYEIVSVVTNVSVENLSLNEGKEVYAIIDAIHVSLATDY